MREEHREMPVSNSVDFWDRARKIQTKDGELKDEERKGFDCKC